MGLQILGACNFMVTRLHNHNALAYPLSIGFRDRIYFHHRKSGSTTIETQIRCLLARDRLFELPPKNRTVTEATI